MTQMLKISGLGYVDRVEGLVRFWPGFCYWSHDLNWSSHQRIAIFHLPTVL